MRTADFEIKVLFLGHVSVGKTTVLNAMLQDTFGEVCTKRTTAAVNYFRLLQLSKESGALDAKEVDDTKANDGNCSVAADILAEIEDDNQNLREKNILCEKTFDVEGVDPICEMRGDTRLVLVDSPGLNEAGSQEMYLDYVRRKWDTFDCAVLVMDALTGVNTDENEKLLEFVKKLSDTCKKMPVLVVCNKVDDVEDLEVMGLVGEVRKAVERIFDVSDREEALSALLSHNRIEDTPLLTRVENWSPAFIPISAESAFLYRSISCLDMKGLASLPAEHIEKIGQKDIGLYNWRKLNHQEKLESVFEIVKDREHYHHCLASSNFDKFLAALHQFLSGDRAQTEMIQAQLDTSLSKIRAGDGGFTDKLISLYERSLAVGCNSDLGRAVDELFWKLLSDVTTNVFHELSCSPANVDSLAVPMMELVNYSNVLWKKKRCPSLTAADSATISKRLEKVMNGMISLIHRQVETVISKQKEWEFPPINKQIGLQVQDLDENNWSICIEDRCWVHSETQQRVAQDTHPAGDKPHHWLWLSSIKKWRHLLTGALRNLPENRNPATVRAILWEMLSARDWNNILESLLLLRHDRHFCEHCSDFIIELEWMGRFGKFTRLEPCKNCNPGQCQCKNTLEYFDRCLEGHRENGVFVPDNPKLYAEVVQVANPQKPSSAAHWGHLVWLFCRYMSTVEKDLGV